MENAENRFGPGQFRSIKVWAEEDRPREKLMLKGKAALTNAELLAIVLGSGSRSETAVELARRMLAQAGERFDQLGRFTLKDLKKFRGVGEAKAIGVMAALEIGRRRQQEEALERFQVGSSRDVFDYLHPMLGDLPHEEFWAIFLNRSNKVIKAERISIGGVAGTVADAKMVFKKAIDALASGLIVAHNHPSGAINPSQADIRLTRQFRQAGDFLDIPLLDHIIVGDRQYYSFADDSQL